MRPRSPWSWSGGSLRWPLRPCRHAEDRAIGIESLSPVVGAGARIDLAFGGTKPACCGLVQTRRDAIAEGGPRRRLIALTRHLIQLRYFRHLDLRGWRRRRRWRIELRPARRNELGRRHICGDLRHGRSSNHDTDNDEHPFHATYVVTPFEERKLNQFTGAFHSSGAFSIGSKRSASNPSRFQDCSMCGGNGAVTSITPPRGCGITIRRARR